MDEIDVFSDAADQTLPTEGGLSRLSRMYQRWCEMREQEALLSAQLAALGEERRLLEEVQFPELFDEVGVSEFKVGDIKLSVDEKLYGSLPKGEDEREAALQELGKWNGTDIIKPTVTVPFPKGDTDVAFEVVEFLKVRGLTYEFKEDVNHMTYKAWAKEELEKGTPLNLQVLGIHNRRFVKETKPRVKKK